MVRDLGVSTPARPDAGADAYGIGFDRTATGSNAVAQYSPPVARRFADPARTGADYLLWFHRLPWTYRLPDGVTLWDALLRRYDRGVSWAAWRCTSAHEQADSLGRPAKRKGGA